MVPFNLLIKITRKTLHIMILKTSLLIELCVASVLCFVPQQQQRTMELPNGNQCQQIKSHSRCHSQNEVIFQQEWLRQFTQTHTHTHSHEHGRLLIINAAAPSNSLINDAKFI